MPDTLTVLGIAGSLRAGSINRALLEAAQELAPDSMTIQIFDLTPIPMYNSELETDERRPAEVIAFKQAITRRRICETSLQAPRRPLCSSQKCWSLKRVRSSTSSAG